MIRRLIPVGLILIAVHCLTGCATVPSSSHVFKREAFDSNDLKGKNVLVVSDICVKRYFADLKDSYVSLFESKRAIHKANKAFSAYLTAQGVEKVVFVSLGLGSYLSTTGKVKVCRYPSAPSSSHAPPLWINDEWFPEGGNERAEQLRNLMLPVWGSYGRTGELADLVGEDNGFRAALRELKRKYDCDYVLLVCGVGWFIPLEQRMKEIVPQAVVSSILTLGTFAMAVYHVSCMTTHVALVDADENRLVWANRFPSSPALTTGTNAVLAEALFRPPLLAFDELPPPHDLISVIHRIPSAGDRAWCRRPCNTSWLELANQMLYHLLPPVGPNGI